MTAQNPITDDSLRRAVAAAQGRAHDEQERLRQVQARLRAAERELALLAELGHLRGLADLSGGNDASSAERETPLQSSLNLARPLTAQRAAPTRRDALVGTVIDILREHGKPMPIRSLMAELVSRGAPIPGRGEQANLISVITRVPEIIRPQRGVYGLREWKLDDAPPPATRPARRTRKAAQ